MTRSLRFSVVASETAPRGGIAIRRARPGDAAAVTTAFNEVFDLRRSAEYWEQKFASPDGPVSFVSVDADGRVLTQFAGSPAVIRHAGSQTPILMIGDVFARRSAEIIRQRVFVRTVAEFHRHIGGSGQYASILGFPNEVSLNVTGHTHTRLTTSPVDDYLLSAEPQRRPRDWRRWWRRRTRILSTPTLTPAFRAGAEAVWKHRRSIADLAEVERSPEWIDWRYDRVGRHYGAYEYHLVVIGDSCVGWCVTRDDPGGLLFVDWATAGDDRAAYERLSDAFRLILERRPEAPPARALMSPQARDRFGDLLAWRDHGVPSWRFAAIEYTHSTAPIHRLRLTYGDTDWW